MEICAHSVTSFSEVRRYFAQEMSYELNRVEVYSSKMCSYNSTI